MPIASSHIHCQVAPPSCEITMPNVTPATMSVS
jgi:hypothetical protein